MVSDNEIGPMLTIREVAELLHIHSNTLRRWADRGIIKAYRITRRGDRRFRREDIARFLAELNVNRGSERKDSSTRVQAIGKIAVAPLISKSAIGMGCAKPRPMAQNILGRILAENLTSCFARFMQSLNAFITNSPSPVGECYKAKIILGIRSQCDRALPAVEALSNATLA